MTYTRVSSKRALHSTIQRILLKLLLRNTLGAAGSQARQQRPLPVYIPAFAWRLSLPLPCSPPPSSPPPPPTPHTLPSANMLAGDSSLCTGWGPPRILLIGWTSPSVGSSRSLWIGVSVQRYTTHPPTPLDRSSCLRLFADFSSV